MLENERNINFFNVIDDLVMMRLSGCTFICEKVVLTQKMANVNETLLGTVDRLKAIVWQVNTKVKNICNSTIQRIW